MPLSRGVVCSEIDISFLLKVFSPRNLTAAQRVANYIEGMTCEATLLAKAAGKTALANMEREDLRAMTLEACAMTGIPLVGSNYTFSEEFGFF